MKISVTKNEPKELVIEFETTDLTLPDLIASELLKNPDVEFAGVSKDHPEIGKPKLVLKTSKKKAVEVLGKSIGNLEEVFTEIKSEVMKKR
jgi:DNA-directed RNA polymerase subunit L